MVLVLKHPKMTLLKQLYKQFKLHTGEWFDAWCTEKMDVSEREGSAHFSDPASVKVAPWSQIKHLVRTDHWLLKAFY